MNGVKGRFFVALFLLISATAAWGDAATIGNTGYCAIWGPTSYEVHGAFFSATINKNWIQATCKWTVEDFELGRADVRRYSGELYNECTIWFGEWPNEIKYPGFGQSTVSASGNATVKCTADVDDCVPAGGVCP